MLIFPGLSSPVMVLGRNKKKLEEPAQAMTSGRQGNAYFLFAKRSVDKINYDEVYNVFFFVDYTDFWADIAILTSDPEQPGKSSGKRNSDQASPAIDCGSAD